MYICYFCSSFRSLNDSVLLFCSLFFCCVLREKFTQRKVSFQWKWRFWSCWIFWFRAHLLERNLRNIDKSCTKVNIIKSWGIIGFWRLKFYIHVKLSCFFLKTTQQNNTQPDRHFTTNSPPLHIYFLFHSTIILYTQHKKKIFKLR